jgi:hypothetical protein
MQTVNGEVAQLKVFTYDELVQEERSRQIATAVLVGLAAGANAAAASQAGYYHSTSTVVGPRGVATVNTTGYSPTGAAIAQSNAAVQNDAMISATIERGQANCGFRRLRPGIPIERGHAFRSKAATCSDEGGRGVVAGMRSGVRFSWWRQDWRVGR